MKCHYIVDKIAGRVLIPGCMAAAVSGDIEQCTCRDFDLSFSQFERKRYNDELKRRNDEINSNYWSNDISDTMKKRVFGSFGKVSDFYTKARNNLK